MDPWPLSEKVRLTLQMIVNYTPVPLPFRRYDWIHRGSWYTGISYLKIGDIKNLEYQWEISGIESSSSLGSSYLRSPNIFLWVNLRIGDFFFPPIWTSPAWRVAGWRGWPVTNGFLGSHCHGQESKLLFFFCSASIVFVVDLYEKMFLHHPESNCNHFFFGI